VLLVTWGVGGRGVPSPERVPSPASRGPRGPASLDFKEPAGPCVFGRAPQLRFPPAPPLGAGVGAAARAPPPPWVGVLAWVPCILYMAWCWMLHVAAQIRKCCVLLLMRYYCYR
jgi:hypothetical protein